MNKLKAVFLFSFQRGIPWMVAHSVNALPKWMLCCKQFFVPQSARTAVQ